MEIPIYDNTGSLAGSRSLESITRLLAVNIITVARNRKGNIVRAFQRQPDGIAGLLSMPLMAQPYIFNELLPCGGHAFRHKKLPKVKNEEEAHRIFRAVQVSCVV